MIHDILENGVEVVLKEDHFSRAVAIQCWVGAGAVDEAEGEYGLAHYIEHMLFKGTERHGVGEIGSKVEACGGDINAYTTFDRTVYYLTLASKNALSGVDLLSDAIFNSTFDREEIEKEREVILEEIKRGNDDPGSKVARRVFALCYEGARPAESIAGDEKSVGGFSREDLVGFHTRWYAPENLSVVIVGDFDEQKMFEVVKKKFGCAASRKLPKRTRVKRAFPDELTVSIIKGDFQQPRISVVYPGLVLEDPDALPLDLAAFSLSSGDSSRFNRRLRDRDGVVVAIAANAFTPGFPGLFEISALTPIESIAGALTGIAKEMSLITSSEPVTEEELSRARENLKIDKIYRDETVDGRATTIGFGLTTSHKVLFDDVYTTKVNGISLSTMATALRRKLDPARAVIAVLCPEGTELSEKELKEAYSQGLKISKKKSGPVSSRSSNVSKIKTELMDIRDGLRLVYRYNPDSELISLSAATEGGLRSEDKENVGINSALSKVLGTASESMSYEKLSERVEGIGAAIYGFSGKDSLGLCVNCLRGQLPEMLGYFRDCLINPVFPADQWAIHKREILERIANQDDSPSGICVRNFQELIFGDHPYRFPVFGTKESVENFDEKMLLDYFVKYRDEGSWLFGASGSLEPSEFKTLLTKALEGFTPKNKRRVFSSDGCPPTSSGRRALTKDREQTHIIAGFSGISWSDEDRAALDVLLNILGGHGGRLFLNLRDRDSLAYTVSPITVYGCHPGAVGSYIACAPEKTDVALLSLKREMFALKDQEVAKEELERSKNYIVGTHEMSLQRSDSQTMTMALMELYGFGYDDFLTYPKNIEKVTTVDVQRVAKRLFIEEKTYEVVVGPA